MCEGTLYILQTHRAHFTLCLRNDVRRAKGSDEPGINFINAGCRYQTLLYELIDLGTRSRDRNYRLRTDGRVRNFRRVITFVRPAYLESAEPERMDNLRSTRDQRKDAEFLHRSTIRMPTCGCPKRKKPDDPAFLLNSMLRELVGRGVLLGVERSYRLGCLGAAGFSCRTTIVP